MRFMHKHGDISGNLVAENEYYWIVRDEKTRKQVALSKELYDIVDDAM